MSDINVCKHGLPITFGWPRPETIDGGFRQTVTVTMCKKCIEEGAAMQIAAWIDKQVRERPKWPSTDGQSGDGK